MAEDELAVQQDLALAGVEHNLTLGLMVILAAVLEANVSVLMVFVVELD